MIGFTYTVTVKKLLTGGPTAAQGFSTAVAPTVALWDAVDRDRLSWVLNIGLLGTVYRAGDGSATYLNTGTAGGATRGWWELTVTVDLADPLGGVRFGYSLVTKDTTGAVLSTTTGSETRYGTIGVNHFKRLRIAQEVSGVGSPAVNRQGYEATLTSSLEIDTVTPISLTEGDPWAGSPVYLKGANTPVGETYLTANGPQDYPSEQLLGGPTLLARRNALTDGFTVYRQSLGGGGWTAVHVFGDACDMNLIAANGPLVAARADWLRVGGGPKRYPYSLDYGDTWATAENATALVAATNTQWPYAFLADGSGAVGGTGSARANDARMGRDGLNLSTVYSLYLSGGGDLLNAVPYSYEAYVAADSVLSPMRQAGEVNGLPQPVLYRSADGTWHVGWFAGEQWREYRSDDLLGSSWTAEEPQDVGVYASLANCTLGLGRDGRQVAAGYLIEWPGGPSSQLVVWTRSGGGGIWQRNGATGIASPTSCVMPYLFEGGDGLWELGWLLGGAFTRYTAMNPAGAWTEVS